MNKRALLIILVVVINCILMGIVDAVIVPHYFIKSLIKLFLFLVGPIITFIIYKDIEYKSILKINKKCILKSLGLGISIFIFILVSYFILGNIFDLSNITNSLTNDIGVNIDNYLYVSIYISIVNSFLEEFFFRGFSFLILKKYSSFRLSLFFSSITFSLYHIAIMISWFNIWTLLLLIVVLFIGGLIFNYINLKYENIYSSWLVHMFANIAINILGFILFLN